MAIHFASTCSRLLKLNFRYTVITFLGSTIFMLAAIQVTAQQCPDPVPQTVGSHSFRQQGETFDIPIAIADCQTLSLELRWSNGRNNGSNFAITFLDADNQAIYTKEISAFLSGNFQFPFATLELQPWRNAGASMSTVSVPTSVTIQAVRPFAFPATLSYRVIRIAGPHGTSRTSTVRQENANGSQSKDSNPLMQLVQGKINER
jgi:hypothetical protein